MYKFNKRYLAYVKIQDLSFFKLILKIDKFYRF